VRCQVRHKIKLRKKARIPIKRIKPCTCFRKEVSCHNRRKVIEQFSNQNENQTRTKEEFSNSLILGDAPKILFHTVVADQPYFVQLPNKQPTRWTVQYVIEGVDHDADKLRSFEEDVESIAEVVKQNADTRLMATSHSISRIGRSRQNLGCSRLNDVSWVKTNTMPNRLGIRFTNATETPFSVVKHKSPDKYAVNKDYRKRGGPATIACVVWVLSVCHGKERLKEVKKHPIHMPTQSRIRITLTSSCRRSGDCLSFI